MEFKIGVVERITRVNTFTVEVEDEDEGEALLNLIEDDINDAEHPDDVVAAIRSQGYAIIEQVEGAEDVEYELD